jgi:hypothetical protein
VKKSKTQVWKTNQGEVFVDVPNPSPSYLDEPYFSINELNELSKQAAEVLIQTHDDAVHKTHVNNFLAIIKVMPAELPAVLLTAATARAIAKELAA